MGIVLDILALVVVLLLIVVVPRAVRKEQPRVSLVLSVFVGLFVIILGVVFLSAASQLAASTSAVTQGVLLAFLALIAILARFVWVSKPPIAQ
jgi:lipopolysaccharide export LptBFGC system permease protein LptF